MIISLSCKTRSFREEVIENKIRFEKASQMKEKMGQQRVAWRSVKNRGEVHLVKSLHVSE